MDILCEALVFELERAPAGTIDVKAAIQAVRDTLGNSPTVTMLTFTRHFRQGTVDETVKTWVKSAMARSGKRAIVPAEVPELPATLQARQGLLDMMKARVLTQANSSISVVGAKQGSRGGATASAHGMGGVGKTLMAVQLIRDAEVGAAFEKLLWVSVGQEPDILQLLRVLHFQLKSKHLPAASMEAEVFAVQAMREACRGVKALLVLDDIWDPKHAETLNCVDVEAGSASVVTTRLRNMSEGEISCGLLTVEESLSLLLSSAGLHELIDKPPAAAYEAIECCGRLALALPIAGGMIRELRELWEVELVPMLKQELSEEMSTEQRIVNASLRCLNPTHRAGVEALFACFGCFAEDDIVPASALDILSPVVCEKAGAAPSHHKVRKWLAALLQASLLNESANGFNVHDLVRDVMVTRVEEEHGGMEVLQRRVVQLFLAAFDELGNGPKSPDNALEGFLIRSLRHHVQQAQQPDVELWNDDLLMSVLTHKADIVSASAVRGIGLEDLQSAIEQCEGAGCWFEASKLWYAASIANGMGSGELLKRGLAAIGNLSDETAETRALESKILSKLLVVVHGGFAFGSPEHTKNMARMRVLAESSQADVDGQIMKLFTYLGSAMTNAGVVRYTPITQGMMDALLPQLNEVARLAQEAARAAPDRTRHSLASNFITFVGVTAQIYHRHPGFQKELFTGAQGALLRSNVEAYDFDSMHAVFKSSVFSMDPFLHGQHTPGLLLFYGDLKGCHAAWAKEMDAWRKIGVLVQQGDRKWSDYHNETLVCYHSAGAMLNAGEMDLFREYIQLLPGKCKRASGPVTDCSPLKPHHAKLTMSSMLLINVRCDRAERPSRCEGVGANTALPPLELGPN